MSKANEFTKGRITAKLCHDSDFDNFWLGKIGGQCVSMKADPKTNKTKEQAISDAMEFKKHSIKTANV